MFVSGRRISGGGRDMETTKSKIEGLRKRADELRAMGGAERVAKQHESGKLSARERLDLLFDAGSFVEMDLHMKHRATQFGMEKQDVPADGVVTGFGTVGGRKVFAYSQDFTSVGGSLGEMHARKITKTMDLALKTGAPIVGFNDSGGARIQEGVDALTGYGQIFFRNSASSGVIPQMAAIMGPCAGGAVYSPAMNDLVFMTKGSSYMFITGPKVIKTVTGEEISSEDLGGAMVHNEKSGVAHFAADSDAEAIAQIREALSYLPSNNMEDPPFLATDDPVDRRDPELDAIIPDAPNAGYDMVEVIRRIVDDGKFFEPHRYYATNILTGWARLGGHVIGIIANNPASLAGVLDTNSADKASRFIRLCDAFNVPLLTITDVPGYLPGVEQEYMGIIRHGAKLLWSYSEATVPKITMITRKDYGGAYLAMCSKDLGADWNVAWPTAEIAVMGAEGAAEIVFAKEIKQAQDPGAVRKAKIEEYRELFANPYVAARRGYVDEVIAPSDSRPHLIHVLTMLLTKRELRPAKKHGNIPL
jgi:acetyl-CoA carboxylase carboxyltransferase component